MERRTKKYNSDSGISTSTSTSTSTSSPPAITSGSPVMSSSQTTTNSTTNTYHIPKTISIPQRAPQPWHTHLTFDLVLLILQRSVFNPFICGLILPLCLRAQLTSWTHPSMLFTLGWALLVAVCHVLAAVNHRIAYGPKRKISHDNDNEGEEENSEEQVVVITGGSGGLGWLIAEIYAIRGWRVVILDINQPQGDGRWLGGECGEKRGEWLMGDLSGRGDEDDLVGDGDLTWYRCDVGKLEEVEEAAGEIRRNFGRVSVLINCAAFPIQAQSLLPPLDIENITKTLNTNLHAHFHTLSAFLPSILSRGGTFVTISSVLGHLHPANLAAYSASKAGVSSLHHTLTHELRSADREGKVKTLLIETGQIATGLFADVVVETPVARFFSPILDTNEVAKAIVHKVDHGDGGVIRMPAYARWVAWYGILPAGVQRFVRWLAGIDEMARGRGISRTSISPELGVTGR